MATDRRLVVVTHVEEAAWLWRIGFLLFIVLPAVAALVRWLV